MYINHAREPGQPAKPAASALTAPGASTMPATALPPAAADTPAESSSSEPQPPTPTQAADPFANTTASAQGPLASAYTWTANRAWNATSSQAEVDAWGQALGPPLVPCPAGFAWDRDAENLGYRCYGGKHFVSESAIASRRPALYYYGDRRDHEDTVRQFRTDWWVRWDTPAPGSCPPGFAGPVLPVGWDHNRKRWEWPSCVLAAVDCQHGETPETGCEARGGP